jgi:hypothetical protein
MNAEQVLCRDSHSPHSYRSIDQIDFENAILLLAISDIDESGQTVSTGEAELRINRQIR